MRSIMMCVCAALLSSHAAAQAQTTLRLREELRIGAVDDPTYGLTFFYHVLPGPDGSVYIPQPQERLIRVFRSDGRFERIIGGRGEGPGEFRHLADIGWRGDTLHAFDAQLSRLTMFTATGELLNTIAFRQSLPDGRVLQPQGFHSDGTLWSLFDLGMPQTPMVPLLRIARDGTVLDTLRYYVFTQPPSFPVTAGGRTLNVPHPVHHHPVVAVQPNRLHGFLITQQPPADARNATFRVSRFTERGDTVWHRSFRYTPRLLNVDSVIDAHVPTYAGQLRVPPAVVARQLGQHVRAPLYAPPVRSALASDDGQLWLRLEVGSGAAVRYAVIDVEGVMTGTVTLPAGVTPLALHRDVVYARLLNDLDVPYLVRYRVVR